MEHSGTVINFSFAQVTILHFNGFIDEELRKRASKYLGNFETHFYCLQVRSLEFATLLQTNKLSEQHFFCLNFFLYIKLIYVE